MFTPTEERGLYSFKPIQLLSKTEFVSLVLLCKSAWYGFTAAQKNLPAKLMTTGEKEF